MRSASIAAFSGLSSDGTPRSRARFDWRTGLVVGGTADLVEPDLFTRTAAQLPAPSRALIVDGAGHWPHREDADAVVPELLTFLAQLDA